MRQPGLAAVVIALALGACGSDNHTVIDAATDGSGGDGGNDEPDARIDALTDGGPTDDGFFIDAPLDGTPGTDDGGGIDAPAPDAAVDASTIDAAVDAPDIDAPDVDAPDLDAPDVDAPDLDAAIDAPDLDAPDLDAAIDAPPVPQTFYWADWASATAGNPGAAAGTFTTPAGPVAITYSGTIAFAQTSGGTNYWVPGAPYINAVTANSPPLPDIIAMNATAVTNTLTFDPPVTGLVLAVVSLGAPGNTVRYVFDRPIDLLSYGAGYWGNGALLVENGTTLAGTEGHGAIQFPGTVSTLTWTLSGGEHWHGWTLGVPAQ